MTPATRWLLENATWFGFLAVAIVLGGWEGTLFYLLGLAAGHIQIVLEKNNDEEEA